MKKWISALLLTALLLGLAACGGTQTTSTNGITVTSTSPTVSDIMESAGEDESVNEPETTAAQDAQAAPATAAAGLEADIDLTKLSSTMVYSEVYDIMVDPEAYVGKVIRMEGQNVSSYYEETDQTYYAIIIQDASACCAQGIEYVLADGTPYPENESEATITGTFASYEEQGMTWYHLTDAVIG